MLGYRVEELLGQEVEMLIPRESHAAHREYRQHYQSAPRSRPMRMTLDLAARTRDGRRIPVDISLSPINFDGQALVVSGPSSS